MFWCILVLLALALVAPWLLRLTRWATGWLLALAPGGILLWLLTRFPPAKPITPILESRSWVPALNLQLSFQLDGLSLLFGILITGIGGFVLIYAGAYLKGHPRLGRFFSFLLLFMAAMLGVVWADHVMTLFVFWELTSISSYLLIGFNNDTVESRDGALQALLVTGMGGLALMAGLILMALVSGTWEFHNLVAQADLLRGAGAYPAILVLVLLGAFTKSAQFPFHFWLPNAMAAPTPVSAYLHSATMVKAGVYLLARLSPILGGTALWQNVLMAFGATTMLVGAFLALNQSDLKKLLAYSTVSALGIMVLLLGVGNTYAAGAAMIFILAHACYKGALFMVAGGVDHGAGTRDVGQLGGLFRKMPVTAVAAGLAACSMAGIPPLFGFLAKESFYETLQHFPVAAPVWVGMALLSSIFLVVVAAWVAWAPFYGARKVTPKAAHEGSVGLWLGPLFLALLALWWGLMPGGFAQSLLEAAASAVAGRAVSFPLKLWHGFNSTLVLSGVTLLSGGILFAARRSLGNLLQVFRPLLAVGPEAWYQWGLSFLKKLATAQTRLWQSGYLRYYLIFVMLTALGLGGVTLITRFDFRFPPLQRDVFPYEILLTSLIMVAALMATVTRSKLSAMAGLGVVGFGVALAFVLYGAPDLAMTQILVETLVVILLVLGFHHMPGYQIRSKRGALIRDLLIAGAVGAFMAMLVLAATQVQFLSPIYEYYAKESLPLAHGRNVVNVILVDFRALDTLGEIVVLALAGLGVYAMLKLKPKQGDPT